MTRINSLLGCLLWKQDVSDKISVSRSSDWLLLMLFQIFSTAMPKAHRRLALRNSNLTESWSLCRRVSMIGQSVSAVNA